MNKVFHFLTLSLCLMFPFTSQSQSLEVFDLFQDHMVLQRDQAIPVFGWAKKGQQVRLLFNGQEVGNTKTAKDGRWEIKLAPMPAGGPHTLEIQTKKEYIHIKDLYFGDVWLCSGQSNMEWTLEHSNRFGQSPADLADPLIRHYKIPHSYNLSPQEKIYSTGWKPGQADEVLDFSAVGFYFAKAIRQHHDVPIGLINSSWGGSRIEPWMSRNSLQNFMDIEDLDGGIQAKELATKKEIAKVFGTIPTYQDALAQQWHQTDFDDQTWPEMQLPGLWEERGLKGVDGEFWFRTSFELTEEDLEGEIWLSLGKIDDDDYSYVNGHLVGSMINAYNKDRLYPLSPEILKAGTNCISIKVVDHGGGGGLYSPANQLYVQTQSGKKSLAGNWRYNIAQLAIDIAANQQPVILYNSMIHPIQRIPIKGVIWYQGESNAYEKDSFVYRDLFKQLIQSWRKQWQQPDLPFYFVQLANYMAPTTDPNAISQWAIVRESQNEALSLNNTHQAVIIDVGETNDIHPRNKRDVGRRLALGARALEYGEEKLPYQSPQLSTIKVEDDGLLLSFDLFNTGLVAKDDLYGYLRGFSIEDQDGQMHWAMAYLVNDYQIKLWHPSIKNIKSIRYAWADNPIDANVFTKEGLPLSPFRRELD